MSILRGVFASLQRKLTTSLGVFEGRAPQASTLPGVFESVCKNIATLLGVFEGQAQHLRYCCTGFCENAVL